MANEIRFDDGAGYERYMGVWSQLAGDMFLSWSAPKAGQRWLDVGCGNGAFTESIVTRCAPRSVDGVDPSSEQLAFARTRPGTSLAQYHLGDAMALPFDADRFDIAVMPLVIFFVPEPSRGIAEMARVVRPGGTVSAYAWDMPGGGFPYFVLQAEMRALGARVPSAPSPEASTLEGMRALWREAGLIAITTREITVHRTFADFDDFWTTSLQGPSVVQGLGTMTSADRAVLAERMRAVLPSESNGNIVCTARANAITGLVRGATQ
jgi:SAM-dependent methyltransferase